MQYSLWPLHPLLWLVAFILVAVAFSSVVWKFIESYKMQWKMFWQRWQRQRSHDRKKMKHIYRIAVALLEWNRKDLGVFHHIYKVQTLLPIFCLENFPNFQRYHETRIIFKGFEKNPPGKRLPQKNPLVYHSFRLAHFIQN